jgi:hypothetical protein
MIVAGDTGFPRRPTANSSTVHHGDRDRHRRDGDPPHRDGDITSKATVTTGTTMAPIITTVPTANHFPLDSKGSGDNPAVVLLAVLGNAPPTTVVINEMTTVASTWTSAQFLDGGRIPNNQLQARVIISIHSFRKVML